MKAPHFESKCQGFTLIELCVVIITLSIMAAMLLPALSQTQNSSRAMDCLNNEKQIIMAAKMYADDNLDNWMPNFPGQTPGWLAGNMNWNSANTDNTNTAILTDANRSVLAPYVKSYTIYRCPEDYSVVPNEGSRVRSVSMNGAVGTIGTATGALVAGSPVNGQWLTGNNIGSSPQTAWCTYGKTSSMNNPGPVSLWIFADEHPNSINDGVLAVSMISGPSAKIIDYPGSFHNGAGSFSFADGHAEIHPWTSSTIRPSIVIGGSSIGNGSISSVGDSASDLQWLQSHTSAAQ